MLNVQNRNWARAVCVMLAALLASLLVVNHARSQQLRDYENRISAVYEKAFYETCELTESISSAYRKLTVASGDAQMLTLLGEISRQAQAAASNIALLPLGQQGISATLKFINQAQDYAATLGEKIAVGGGATEADFRAMTALADRAAQFSEEMEALLAGYEGEAVFSADSIPMADDEAMHPLTNTASDYPTLLYDGPFSDGQTSGNYAMLQDKPEVTSEQAREKLAAFLQADEIAYLGETMPEIPVYEFQMQAGEYRISAGVTRQGGEILYLLPENKGIRTLMAQDMLYAAGENFLREHGYGEMHMSYASHYDGILTINYAAVQDGVILYPDLVKLQISMRDGRVIGFDARAYLKNHIEREIPEPVLAPEDAAANIGPKLTAGSVRLCIIPQNGAEYLCYEVSATDGVDSFLAYIDASSGVERDLMQLVSSAMGTLVM